MIYRRSWSEVVARFANDGRDIWHWFTAHSPWLLVALAALALLTLALHRHWRRRPGGRVREYEPVLWLVTSIGLIFWLFRLYQERPNDPVDTAIILMFGLTSLYSIGVMLVAGGAWPLERLALLAYVLTDTALYVPASVNRVLHLVGIDRFPTDWISDLFRACLFVGGPLLAITLTIYLRERRARTTVDRDGEHEGLP